MVKPYRAPLWILESETQLREGLNKVSAQVLSYEQYRETLIKSLIEEIEKIDEE